MIAILPDIFKNSLDGKIELLKFSDNYRIWLRCPRFYDNYGHKKEYKITSY